jgi:hypothetical protein
MHGVAWLLPNCSFQNHNTIIIDGDSKMPVTENIILPYPVSKKTINYSNIAFADCYELNTLNNLDFINKLVLWTDSY